MYILNQAIVWCITALNFKSLLHPTAHSLSPPKILILFLESVRSQQGEDDENIRKIVCLKKNDHKRWVAFLGSHLKGNLRV